MIKKAKNNGNVELTFKFSKIDPASVQWRILGSKYQEIIDAVSKMPIGEAIRVEGIEKDYALHSIRSKVYKLVKGNYKIRVRYVPESQVGYFYKQAN